MDPLNVEIETTHARRPTLEAVGTWKLIGSLTALGLITRLFFLAHKSFWLDEAASYFIASLSPADFRHALRSHELNMGLYYVLLRGWMHLGTSDWTLRLLSAIPAVATIPVIYLLGNRLFSRRVGVWAALLLTFSAGHVAYAQEARGYSLAILWMSLSSLFFVRALPFDPPMPDRRPSAWNWVAYVLCSTATLYTHFFALLAIAAQWLSLLAWPRERWPLRRLVTAAFALAALALPAVWFALTKNTNQLDWIQKLNFNAVFKTLALLAGNPAALPVYLILWWKAIQAMRTRRTRPQPRQAQQHPLSGTHGEAWPLAFVGAWLWMPFAIVFLASLHKPILHPRFLLISLPAAVLLAAAGMEELRPQRQQVALIVLVLLSVGGLIYYYARAQEDWRGATAYVLQQAHPGDAVFVGPNYGSLGYAYYLRMHPPCGAVLHTPGDLNGDAHFPRIWLLIYGKKTEPESKLLLESIERANYRPASVRHFAHIDVYLYLPS
jgi:mannosyltransferase